jgi:hypothetical protein
MGSFCSLRSNWRSIAIFSRKSDHDSAQGAPADIEPLEDGIKRVYASGVDSSDIFGREDLSFAGLLRRNKGEFPFKTRLNPSKSPIATVWMCRKRTDTLFDARHG